MWINSRKFDEDKNTVTLNGDYIFSFDTSDGFSERLLGAELLIDHDFNYIFRMKAFQHEKITKNGSDVYTEEGEVPETIFNYLEKLMDSDYQSLKQIYENVTFCMTDTGSQMFLMNWAKPLYISITEGLPQEFFVSETEQLLFNFNQYLKKWVEEKYRNWLK
ncbi:MULTISPECIES: hypothetical protein [Chryseobacterium]|uniref:hypothetical protein n=1 Tax=Chryseobacterium TaxID=59732 RepID=UPI0012981701|nr:MULTISPECIES: hypothetical protein [Chryseobacterium]MDR6920904.1 hypothetical protein [Chryseobacterium sp. 2987]